MLKGTARDEGTGGICNRKGASIGTRGIRVLKGTAGMLAPESFVTGSGHPSASEASVCEGHSRVRQLQRHLRLEAIVHRHYQPWLANIS